VRGFSLVYDGFDPEAGGLRETLTSTGNRFLCKPHPEMFLAAARELGVEPERAFIIENAEAGIEAAKAGAMTGLGIARADDASLLAAAHADLVVTTLDDVDVAALSHGRLATTAASAPTASP
jgi:beta-phosphoglucomutase-like phosphatase (HAD superfamily)